jgi:mannose-6-phosphate isomerase-like protein (cupin superfamily)
LLAYSSKNSLKVKKDMFVYIPPQMPHNVTNTGRKLLKYIYTAARV